MENIVVQPAQVPLVIIAVVNSVLAVLGIFGLVILYREFLAKGDIATKHRARKVMYTGLIGFVFHLGYLVTLVAGVHFAVFWASSVVFNTAFAFFYIKTIWRALRSTTRPGPTMKPRLGEVILFALCLSWTLFVGSSSVYYFIFAINWAPQAFR